MTCSICEADSDEPYRLRRLAVIGRFRGIAEHVYFRAAVHVPRSESRRRFAQRQRQHRPNIEIPELMIGARELVVVVEAETDSCRYRESGSHPNGEGRHGAELEIGAFPAAVVRLSGVVQL